MSKTTEGICQQSPYPKILEEQTGGIMGEVCAQSALLSQI